MKRRKPKLYQYRMKRGFFLCPRWEEFKATSDLNALDWVSEYMEQCEMWLFRYREVTVQKLVNGKWVDV